MDDFEHEPVTSSANRLRVRPLLHAGGAGLVAVAGGVVSEVLHRRHLAGSSEHARLQAPLHGEPVTARSADGTKIYAEVFGPGDGFTFVLGPGWTETLQMFDSMTRLLVDQGFRVVAYDLRGQGQSGRAAGGDYTLERYGEDLEAVLAAACDGRRDVIVAGHSMGAMSIAAWAAGHDVEARVSGAVLMNTGLDGLIKATHVLPRGLPPALAHQLALYAFLGNPLPFPAFSTGISRAGIRYTAFGPEASAAQVALYEHMLVTCPPSVRRAAGIAMANMDLLHALPCVTVPTLVLAGAVDRLTPPSHATKIAEQLPNPAGLEILPGIGHMGPLEAPERIVAALAELAARIAVPAVPKHRRRRAA